MGVARGGKKKKNLVEERLTTSGKGGYIKGVP